MRRARRERGRKGGRGRRKRPEEEGKEEKRGKELKKMDAINCTFLQNVRVSLAFLGVSRLSPCSLCPYVIHFITHSLLLQLPLWGMGEGGVHGGELNQLNMFT